MHRQPNKYINYSIKYNSHYYYCISQDATVQATNPDSELLRKAWKDIGLPTESVSRLESQTKCSPLRNLSDKKCKNALVPPWILEHHCPLGTCHC